MNKEIERKKEKRIDRSHWMSKVQKYIFGIDAPTFYSGYCPFFWMTVLALAVSPVIVTILLIVTPIRWIFEKVDKLTTKHSQKSTKARRSQPLEPSFTQFITLAKHFNAGEFEGPKAGNYLATMLYSWGNTKSYLDAERIELWLTQNPNWMDTHVPAARIKYDAWKESEKKKKEKDALRTQRIRKLINKVSIVGKIIFKCVIPLAILMVGTGVGWLLYLFFISVNVQGLITFATAIGIIVGVALTVGAIILPFAYISWVKTEVLPHKSEKKGLNIPERLIDWTCNTIDFLKEIVYMTYKSECPMIVWGEETGPIVKRKTSQDNEL